MPSETEILKEHTVNPPDVDFTPSQREQSIVRDTFYKFRQSADERNREFEYFDGRNLVRYINDSTKRFITNYYERDGLEDWQARVNEQFTRNKVLAVLGKVVSVLPIASVMPRGDEDIRKASILTDLYQFSEDKDDYEEFMTHFLLEAIVKGTAVGYEGVENHKRKIRKITGSGDDITVSEKTKEEVKLFAEIVPLEEFYPSSVGIRTIKEMPYCFWSKEYSYPEFISRFSQYSKSTKVTPKTADTQAEDKPFYSDFITSSVEPGNVEVIRYYNVIDDCYVIIANGVWLNPLTIGADEEVLSPLPFNHKRLPFFDVKFDFLGNWFYGKSLPDKLSPMQDVLNVLTNMLLDQSFLTIFPPVLTTGYDGIEDDYLRPGRRTPIDTQGLPINQAFAKLDLGTPTGWHQFILEYTRKVMEESSMDRVSQGIAGVGDRTTAQEIRVAAEGVASILGLFGRIVNYGLKQKAFLRCANILQFWTDPKLPVLKGVLGDSGDKLFADAFNLFKVNNTVLTDGTRGSRVIAMFASDKNMPEIKELKARSNAIKQMTGQNIDYVAAASDYISSMDFDIKIAMDSRKEATRDLDKAIQLEKVRVYLGLFPPNTFNVAEIAAQTAEKLGDDPSKVLSQESGDALAQLINPKEAAKPASASPTTDISKNMADMGSSGIEGGLQNMAQLAGQMTG